MIPLTISNFSKVESYFFLKNAGNRELDNIANYHIILSIHKDGILKWGGISPYTSNNLSNAIQEEKKEIQLFCLLLIHCIHQYQGKKSTF